MFKSIRTPLIIFLVAILLMTNGLISFYTLSESTKQLKFEAEKGLGATLEETKKVISSRIQTEVTFLEELSSETILDAPQSWEEKVATIQEKAENRGYIAIARIEPDGIITRYDAQKSKGDANGRAYFEKALSGSPAVSEIIISSVTGEPIIVIAVPIIRAGKVVGVLNGVRPQEGLNKIIEDFKYGETGDAFILSKKGIVVAHTNKPYVVNQVDFIKLIEEKSPSHAEIIQNNIHSQETFITEITNHLGKDELLAISPLEDSEWVIFATVSLDEILGDILHLKILLIGFIAGVLLVSIGISLLILKRITKPLLALTDQIEWMSKDHLDEKMPQGYTHKKNEIGRLSSSFERMRQKIQESFLEIKQNNETLEQKISDRTKELTDSLLSLKTTQNQLMESQKDLTLALMTRWIAHHLNTPLGNLVSIQSLLKEDLLKNYGPLRENTLEALTIIDRNTQRSVRIIESLKRLSLASDHAQTETVEMATFIKQNLAFINDSYDDLHDKILIESNEPIHVTLNPTAFLQVLSILIENIFQHAYTFQEYQRGIIKIKQVDGKVAIQIRDFGKGISPEQEDLLFKPFFENFTGAFQSGLGLQIAMNLVKTQLEGNLYFTRPEKGASFTLEMPLKK